MGSQANLGFFRFFQVRIRRLAILLPLQIWLVAPMSLIYVIGIGMYNETHEI